MASLVSAVCFAVTKERGALPTVLLRHLNLRWGCLWKLSESCESYDMEKKDDCDSSSARINVLSIASITS